MRYAQTLAIAAIKMTFYIAEIKPMLAFSRMNRDVPVRYAEVNPTASTDFAEKICDLIYSLAGPTRLDPRSDKSIYSYPLVYAVGYAFVTNPSIAYIGIEFALHRLFLSNWLKFLILNLAHAISIRIYNALSGNKSCLLSHLWPPLNSIEATILVILQLQSLFAGQFVIILIVMFYYRTRDMLLAIDSATSNRSY